jgi:3-phosphoshikimate 1-carboxyvinyltransferase
MTIDILKMAGVKIETDPNLSTILIKGSQKFNPITYSVEGDWSSASFFLVAGAISGGLFVKNLNTQSAQADRKILDVLHYCGAVIEALPQGIRVERKELRAFEFDVSDSPDLFPPLCILAACAEGISTIYGTDRQLFKESNRLERICEGFTRLGVRFELSQGKISIEGRENIGSGTIDPMGDHRIAMAFAILGLRSKEGVRISNPGCVNKSYPEFFTELMRIKK